MLRLTLVLLAGFALSQTSEASQSSRKPAAAAELGAALPPIGFVNFCKSNQASCVNSGTPVGSLRLTDRVWASLSAVNSAVNGAIVPMSDEELYGVPEFWTYPVQAGDCEDYLLLKKRNLEKLGFPSQSLLITVVLDEKDEGHAVLTVLTDKGDLVLDNRREDILNWRDTGYRFLKRQSREDAQEWVALSDAGQSETAVSSGD
jgi:predicted transglutaminase-like cysteine proteinase